MKTNFHRNYNNYSIYKDVSESYNSRNKVEMLTNELHCGTTDNNIFHHIIMVPKSTTIFAVKSNLIFLSVIIKDSSTLLQFS